MSDRSNGRRLLSPAGFVLVMLCFLFPFIAVSCQSPVGSVSVQYSGNDLAFGGQPTVSTSDGQVPQTSDIPPSTPQPLALLTYLLTIGGLVVTLVQSRRVRVRLVAIFSGAAAFFLILNEIVVYDGIVSRLAGQSGGQFDSGFDSRPSTIEAVRSLVHTQIGFWFTMLLLLGIMTINIIELARIRDAVGRTGPPGSAYPTGPAP